MAGPAHLPGRFGRSRPGFVSLVVVVVIASVFAVASPAAATVSGQDGRIAYVAGGDNGDADIWSVNPDGTDPVNLTRTGGTGEVKVHDREVAWSPDGLRIAFTRTITYPVVDEPDIESSSVWVMDADGSNQQLIVEDGWDPTWSPDGGRLAYVTDVVDEETGFEMTAIAVFDLVDGTSTVVTDPGPQYSPYDDPAPPRPAYDRTPVWSPYGSVIYYAHFFCPATPISCHTDLMSVDPDTGTTTTVVPHASRTSFYLDVSPGGRWLVTVDATVPVPPEAVVLRDIATSDEVRLAMGTTVTGAAFSPSGDRLAVGLDESRMMPPSSIWTMDLDGGNRVEVVKGASPAWQPVNPYPFGLVDPDQGEWHLRHVDGVVESFYFGNPGDVPFLGDWDCDGIDTPGLYRQSDGYVYLRNTNTQGIADISFFFGNPGDLPIAGDFNGDGCSTVSVYRPSTQTFYIINELGDADMGLGAADTSYVFGDPGDKPYVGDFDGDGIDTVGLHRESTGLVYYRNTHTQGIADGQFIFGDPGDRLVAFDWNGDGMDAPGLFRPGTTTVYLRFTNTQGVADAQWIMGDSDWLPVVGVFE